MDVGRDKAYRLADEGADFYRVTFLDDWLTGCTNVLRQRNNYLTG